MKYSGKIYGKIGGKFVPLKLTSEEVDDLQADKARLDWLADPKNNNGNVQLPIGAIQENLHCMRAAIDAAMTGNYEKNCPIVG